MGTDVRYQFDLRGVDWPDLKATLSADAFDNGRTPAQLRTSFANSHSACIAYDETGRIVGTARVVSDGVCNAYLVDVWTLTAYRRRGIARAMIESLLARVPGQHVYLFTDDVPEFYKRLGFVERPTGLERVVGQWLVNPAAGEGEAAKPMTDAELLRQFEARSLPAALWTHRAHVRVAFTYLREQPLAGALSRMRAGVQAINAAHGITESATSGYNETTTHAFLHLIAATMRAYGRVFPTPDADAFCAAHPQLMTRHTLRLFYSPERRMHPNAKTTFVEPDLAPLPSLGDP